MADQYLLARLFTSRNHTLTVRCSQCHRLFAKNVLACFQGLDGLVCMPVRRQANVYHVDRRIGKQLIEVGVTLNSGKVDLFSRWAEVSLNASPIPCPFGLRSRADCRDVDSFDLLIRQPVDPTHEADSGDSDVSKLSHADFLFETLAGAREGSIS